MTRFSPRPAQPLLPFLAEISGAAESAIVAATVGYAAAAIVLVQLKYYLRRRR